MSATRSIICVTTLFLAAGSAVAEPYQFEISGSIAQSETSVRGISQTFEVDTNSLNARFYLEPVDASGPLGERAFLDKASSLGVSLTKSEPEAGETVDGFSADVLIVTEQDLIIDIGFSRIESSDDDLDTYRLGVGKYIDGRTTMTGALSRTSDGDLKIDSLSGIFRKVEQASAKNAYVAYRAGASLQQVSDDFDNSDTGFALNVAATYYPSEKFGLGCGLIFQSIDSIDQTTFSVDAQYFITDAFSVIAGYSRISFESDLDVDTLLVSALLRL